MSCNVRKATAERLRVKLIGKKLVGFDTKRWDVVDADGAIKGRIGTKVGAKTAPATI